MGESSTPSNESIKSALGAIERATEPRFFFLFGSFVFALDCGINFLTQKNLYTLGPGISIAEFDWGKILVFLLVFSFLMAFAMRVMRHVVEDFLQDPAIHLAAWWDGWGVGKQTRYNNHEHSAWGAMRIALDRNDKLLYDTAKAAADRYSSKLKNRIETAQMAFSTLIFMILNRFLFGDSASPTILQRFTMWSESRGDGYEVIVYAFWGIVIFAWLFAAFFFDTPREKVYVPELESDSK